MTNIPPDLFVDTHQGSRKAPDLWAALNGDLTIDGAVKRQAQLRKDITAWRKTGERLRERLAENREELDQAGMVGDQKLEPSERAFFDAYERTEVILPGDPPLPPVHGDNS